MIGDLEQQVSGCKKEAQLWANEKLRLEAEIRALEAKSAESGQRVELEERIDGLISVNEELRNLIHEERQVMLEEVSNLEN